MRINIMFTVNRKDHTTETCKLHINYVYTGELNLAQGTKNENIRNKLKTTIW